MNKEQAIAVSRLSVVRGSIAVLNDIDLLVEVGQRMLVFGRNGAGKTTLLKTILGLISPDSGSVEVLGHTVGSRAWYLERKDVGYVNQESVQVDFPISALEVVQIGVSARSMSRRERQLQVENAMQITGCSTLRKRPYTHLSGGEKQKVSLARCICQNPRVLVLDEPTSSLDPAAKEEIMSILEILNRDLEVTILMVSHDVSHVNQKHWSMMRLAAGRFQTHQGPSNSDE